MQAIIDCTNHQLENKAMDMTVSKTILAQLGGNKFVVMTGAKEFVGGDDCLSFRLPANMTKGRATHMRIIHASNDTYTMETYKIVRFEFRSISVVEHVHAEQLHSVFTSMTGLATSLRSAA